MHFICMVSGREEEGLHGATAQMNFPTLPVSSGRCLRTRTHTHGPRACEPRPLPPLCSFSRTHSTLSTLVLLHHAFHKFHQAARAPQPLKTSVIRTEAVGGDGGGGGGGLRERERKKKNLAGGHLGFSSSVEQRREADKCSVWGQL